MTSGAGTAYPLVVLQFTPVVSQPENRVAESLVLYIDFCWTSSVSLSFFFFFFFFRYYIVFPSMIFFLVIVLSFLLRLTMSEYPFDIFTLFLFQIRNRTHRAFIVSYPFQKDENIFVCKLKWPLLYFIVVNTIVFSFILYKKLIYRGNVIRDKVSFRI